MQQTIKYITIIFGFVTLLILFSQVRDCNAQTTREQTVFTPTDSSFQPVVTSIYQPSSLPFSIKNSGFKLPSNIRERDVKRVVSVKLKESSLSIGKPSLNPSLSEGGNIINLIEAKNGRVYVAKDSLVESVAITEFVPSMISYGLFFSVGISGGLDGNSKLHAFPAVTVSINEAYGWLRVPMFMVDWEGVGVGLQAKFYHEIYLGAAYQVQWNEARCLKATIQYGF